MELRELLSGQVETISSQETVAEAAARMQRTNVGSLAVVDDEDLSGIFTERDVLQLVAAGGDAELEKVGAWMTMYPDAVDPEMDVSDAADWMLAAGYRHLPVVEGDKLIGMASIKDILWALTGDMVK